MGIGGFGGVIQTEVLAFEQNAVIVSQHRTIYEFERSLSVIKRYDIRYRDCILVFRQGASINES